MSVLSRWMKSLAAEIDDVATELQSLRDDAARDGANSRQLAELDEMIREAKRNCEEMQQMAVERT